MYLGRADCDSRINELKADFSLEGFCARNFWALQAALGVRMPTHNLMSVFRNNLMCQTVHHSLSTLHHNMLAVGAFWENPKAKPDKSPLRQAVARQRRHRFEGTWANAGEPVSPQSA